MEFNGTFTLEGATTEEVWLAFSDPVMIKNALPGCQFLVEVDSEDPSDVDFEALEAEAAEREDPPTLPEADPETVAERSFEEGSHYAALLQLSVGSVKPRFETVITIDRREMPEMDASGQGQSSNSSFDMTSGMTLHEVDGGVDVEWWANTDVFGRIANMGQRIINPVANRVVKRFFKQVQSKISDVNEDDTGVRDRIRELL
ncbi:CoxG family protein [Halobacterium wangiae]|uniref:CoxG family protein n=1 Tax=Halobacterium wangiae TaxID=2902623 RepID=UPI001E2BB0C5|nr:SRPBCC domain-containing protein [Halobacterium wangiae]